MTGSCERRRARGRPPVSTGLYSAQYFIQEGGMTSGIGKERFGPQNRRPNRSLRVLSHIPAGYRATRHLGQDERVVQVEAGAPLAAGRLPCLASLALSGSLIPATYTGQRSRRNAESAHSAQEQIHFFKNMLSPGD